MFYDDYLPIWEYEVIDYRLDDVIAALKYVVSWSFFKIGTKGGLYFKLKTEFQSIPLNQGCDVIYCISYFIL